MKYGKAKHKKTDSSLYNKWSSYKTKGICCEEWFRDFNTFLMWAVKHGYKKGMTISRIDKSETFNPNNAIIC